MERSIKESLEFYEKFKTNFKRTRMKDLTISYNRKKYLDRKTNRTITEYLDRPKTVVEEIIEKRKSENFTKIDANNLKKKKRCCSIL